MKKAIIILAALLLSMCLIIIPSKPVHASPTVLPLVSQGVPAFASSQKYSSVAASKANDNTYDTYWRSSGPAWLAYDLSSKALIGNVLVVWYNTLTGTYDHSLTGEKAYNLPGTYTIDTNAAPGGGSPPTSGWVSQVSATGNTYHSRQATVNMAGMNWLRINVSVVDGSASNMDVALNMDVYDTSSVSAPLPDDFMFYGDSITRSAMTQTSTNGVASFAQLIANANPGHWPVQESGGIGGYKTIDGVNHLPTWLSIFPGSHITLNYGTNDALGGTTQAAVYANFNTMVQDALAAGVVPIIPTIMWGTNSNIQRYGPVVNAAIQQIYAAYPTQVIAGPDLWNTFLNHPEWLNSDGIHPNSVGAGVYRTAYACSIDSAIYGVSC